jgi:hypothetical protein
MPSLVKNLDGTKHIHIYVRMKNLDGTTDLKRYRCIHPDCFHWAYRNMIKGKRSICSICQKREIVLDYENLRRANPSCFECGTGKKARAIREKFQKLNQLFDEPAEETTTQSIEITKTGDFPDAKTF